jgi:hypothetical protein
MTGICIELKTACKHCSSPLMLNAFTEDILCASCGKTNTFSTETWKSLLDDAMKEAPKFKPGEGQPSTIMQGEYTYKLMYGRQEPRCGKCKENIDVSKMEEYSNSGTAICLKCSNPVFIRKPSELISGIFSSVKYLAGEDEDLLSVHKSGEKLPSAAKPVLFTCPSCAGNLKIDGTDRMIECQFCNSQIYLPDDLWFRLHPPKTVERWYMVVDEKSKQQKKDKEGKPVIELPEWYYLSDVAIDSAGNLYFASSVEGDSDFSVWSIAPDLSTRWIRNGLRFSHEDTRLCMTYDNNLYLIDKNKHSLLKLSSKDGSTISKTEGSPDKSRMNLKGCTSVVSCPDKSILALINNTFARFNEQGERINLWEARKFGLFSAGVGDDIPESDSEWAPYVKDIGSSPKRLSGDFTKFTVGWDGYLYMIDRSSSDGEIAKYEMDGTRLWSKYIPLKYKDCKAGIDSDGNIYVVGTTEDSNTHLVRLNIYNFEFETLLTDITEGGVLHDEDQLAVAPNGTIYILKFYNRLKIFSPEMKMIYRSKQSETDDNELIKKKRLAKENDEEF